MRIASGIAATSVSMIAAWVASEGVAAADTFSGEVVSADGRWTAAPRRIVTDAVIRTDDGAEVAVVQLGGRAGGYGQVIWPSPPRLEPGMRVTVRTRRDPDRRARAVHVVEDVTVLAGGAAPFVRTGPTEAGNYLAWASGCVFLTYDRRGTADLPGDLEVTVLDSVVAAWNDALDGCSYLQLVREDERVDGEVAHDGVNLVLFRDDVWCRPATDDLPEVCLPSGAAGLTTVTYVDDVDSARDGEIVDADIELNGEEFAISSEGATTGGPPCLSDLANTFTHELGHLLGLDHTCLAANDPAKVDGEGRPVPQCSQTTDPEITEATMYNFQDCGETKKISLEPDDVAAVCAAYPADEDPGTCAPPGDSGGCCQTGGGRGGAGGAALVSVLVALAAAACRARSRG